MKHLYRDNNYYNDFTEFTKVLI